LITYGNLLHHCSINWACPHEKRGETSEPDPVVALLF